MIKNFITISIFNTMSMYISTHPIFLSVILFVQTTLTTLISRTILSSSWMPLSIFLMMVGGLMVLFIYITSLSSNSKSPTPPMNKMFLIGGFCIFILMNYEMMTITCDYPALMDMYNMEFIKLFLPMNLISSVFMFFYLLIMLIIMIEILSANTGPLRKKY